jgi:hypothetical protein
MLFEVSPSTFHAIYYPKMLGARHCQSLPRLIDVLEGLGKNLLAWRRREVKMLEFASLTPTYKTSEPKRMQGFSGRRNYWSTMG